MTSSRVTYFEKRSKNKKGRVPKVKHTLRDKRPKGGKRDDYSDE